MVGSGVGEGEKGGEGGMKNFLRGISFDDFHHKKDRSCKESLKGAFLINLILTFS